MTIVVTGAYGQLGDELCRQIGPDAQGLDVDSVDLTNSVVVRRRLLEIRPTWVINCAAYTAVDQAESEAEQAFIINRNSPGEMARAVADYVAGMTDRYALDLYQDIFLPKPWAVM